MKNISGILALIFMFLASFWFAGCADSGATDNSTMLAVDLDEYDDEDDGNDCFKLNHYNIKP